MTPEALFSICSILVLPGWILLLVAPCWKWTKRLINSCLLPLLLGVVYLYLIAAHWGESEGGFGSLAEVSQLFQNPYNLLAGWVHYLAFDLFIGGWEARDARRLRIHHLLLVPCLVLTFLFGPIGLLFYFILRWTIKRKFFIGEEDA